MTHHTIDCEPAIRLFDEMMQAAPTHRMLRLWGEAKMGKSHLLTKVFPGLAQQTYQTSCSVVDLRSSNVTVPDILHQTCAQLGGEGRFPAYYREYEAWLNLSPVVQVKGLQALFSSLSIRAAEPEGEARRVERQLTSKFGADLAGLAPQALLLMFDAVEQSAPSIQNWLMDELLVSVMPLAHVRVVVAGRTIPAAAGSYTTRCRSYELTAVQDEAAYVSYCRQLQLNIEEPLIKGFAHLLDYKPGLFVDMVLPKYGPKRAAHE